MAQCILPANVNPTTGDDTATINEDSAINVAELANDSDPAGGFDPLRIDSVTNGSKGATAIDTRGTPSTTDDEIIYTPNATTASLTRLVTVTAAR